MIITKRLYGLCLLGALLSITTTSAKDDTLTERAFGKDVTEAVIRKISRTNIFKDDHSFYIRLAFIESRFGEYNNTFRADYYGGIWQVEESVFRITQSNHSSLTNLYSAIEKEYNIKWMQLTWRDLLKPMHSGLAAALYFARVPADIPDKVPAQALHWQRYYRPLGAAEQFIVDAESLKNETRCRGKMDLCIVLDGSQSINYVDNKNYERATNFTASMIESFTLDYTRIGMLVFSTTTTDTFLLQNNLTIAEMAALARKAPYPNQTTRTDLGIFRAIEMFKNATLIEGIPQVVAVFTDGQSTRGSNMTGAVSAIQNNNIKSISVGIGNELNDDELALIALNDTESVFKLTNYDALQDFLFTITSLTCELPQKPGTNGSYEDSLIKDERRIYEIRLPPLGITISLTINSGTTNGYWSLTEKVPTSAVHDGRLSGSDFFAGNGNKQANEEGTSLYISIQGVEATNNYTLSTEPGNTKTSGGVTLNLSNMLIVLLASLLIPFN